MTLVSPEINCAKSYRVEASELAGMRVVVSHIRNPYTCANEVTLTNKPRRLPSNGTCHWRWNCINITNEKYTVIEPEFDIKLALTLRKNSDFHRPVLLTEDETSIITLLMQTNKQKIGCHRTELTTEDKTSIKLLTHTHRQNYKHKK